MRYTHSELDALSADEVRAIAELNGIVYARKTDAIKDILYLEDEVIRPDSNSVDSVQDSTTTEPEPTQEPTPDPVVLDADPVVLELTPVVAPAPISQSRIDMLTALSQPFCRTCGQTRSTDRTGKQICPNGTPGLCQFS